VIEERDLEDIWEALALNVGMVYGLLSVIMHVMCHPSSRRLLRKEWNALREDAMHLSLGRGAKSSDLSEQLLPRENNNKQHPVLCVYSREKSRNVDLDSYEGDAEDDLQRVESPPASNSAEHDSSYDTENGALLDPNALQSQTRADYRECNGEDLDSHSICPDGLVTNCLRCISPRIVNQNAGLYRSSSEGPYDEGNHTHFGRYFYRGTLQSAFKGTFKRRHSRRDSSIAESGGLHVTFDFQPEDTDQDKCSQSWREIREKMIKEDRVRKAEEYEKWLNSLSKEEREEHLRNEMKKKKVLIGVDHKAGLGLLFWK